MNKTGVESGTGRLAFALMLLGCSLSALADGYVTLTKSSSTSKGFAGADWSETVADPSVRDYLVNNNRIFLHDFWRNSQCSFSDSWRGGWHRG